jgi:hypothetical protein
MDEAEESLDYWISNHTFHTFGDNENYKEKPEYIEAQKFWSKRKAELYETYKNDYKVKRFLDNLTVTEFCRGEEEADVADGADKEGCDAYRVELILKFGVNNHHPRQYSHFYVYLCYDPNAIKRKQKQIKIRDYEWWGHCFDDRNDIDDDASLDKKLYQEFLNEMGWEELEQKDVSHIFTVLFSYFSDDNITIQF